MIQFQKNDHNVCGFKMAPIINGMGNILVFSTGASCLTLMSCLALQALGVEGPLKMAPLIVMPVAALWLGRKIFTIQNLVDCCNR